jgi:uncharacterized membrane protein YkoI
MRPLLTSLLLLCTVAFTASAPLAAHASATALADQCWADWSTAAPVVHRESLRPAKDVRDLAQKNSSGQLLNITLCAEQGKYVYRLLILKTAGTVEAVTVDARHPFSK